MTVSEPSQVIQPSIPDGGQCNEQSVPQLSPAYGIIDPDYARIFTIARCIAWAEGYALVMHGSFTRDLDLIAIPWAAHACEPDHLAKRIENAAGLTISVPPKNDKPFGRLVWTMMLPTFADPRFVDLSITPKHPVTDAAFIAHAWNCHDDLTAALKTALDHIEHMAAWIAAQKAGYSFESLGEDMPNMRRALLSSTRKDERA